MAAALRSKSSRDSLSTTVSQFRGKMGASLHRLSRGRGIGGKPPFFMPVFGMFGYGGPLASMHLGGRALVSSKTEESKMVYILLLEREALLSRSGSEKTWRTNGGIRHPTEDEISWSSPQGSFTKEANIMKGIRDLKQKQMASFLNGGTARWILLLLTVAIIPGCRACKGKEVCFLLMPCRHLCLCEDREGVVDACPVCHGMKTASVQVFMP